MSSFLDELKQKLKSGKANAELKIITTGSGGQKPQNSSGIQWGKILGVALAVAAIAALIFCIILFLNNQKEKSANLNILPPSTTNERDDEDDDPITDLDFEHATTAAERIEKRPPVQDPNFTLLSELL